MGRGHPVCAPPPGHGNPPASFSWGLSGALSRMFCGLRSRWEMLWSWRNLRAQAGEGGEGDSGSPKAPRALRLPEEEEEDEEEQEEEEEGALTQLLEEDACHLLGQQAPRADEAGQVPPGAELHDQVDVLAVPLRDTNWGLTGDHPKPRPAPRGSRRDPETPAEPPGCAPRAPPGSP